MVSKILTVGGKEGFHIRLADKFTGEMMKYSSDIKIRWKGKEVNGKSIMSILSLGIRSGSRIEIVCTGLDETDMLCRASSIIENEFS